MEMLAYQGLFRRTHRQRTQEHSIRRADRFQRLLTGKLAISDTTELARPGKLSHALPIRNRHGRVARVSVMRVRQQRDAAVAADCAPHHHVLQIGTMVFAVAKCDQHRRPAAFGIIRSPQRDARCLLMNLAQLQPELVDDMGAQLTLNRFEPGLREGIERIRQAVVSPFLRPVLRKQP